MATCNDCAHVEACKAIVTIINEATGLQINDDTETTIDADLNCEYFADRSRFIELPCKVGDTAYIIHSYKDYEGFIQEVTVSGIHLRDTIGYRNIPRAEYLVVRGNVNLSKHIKLKEIGKTVFFTREEAERALKEHESE